jgi:MFS family permease
VALILVTALASFESTVVSTAMPTIIGDLGGLPLYSWVFSAYLLASTITMPLFGRLADIHGRRRVLLAAIVIFLTGAGMCAAARSMAQLIAARGLQGLGAGGLLPIALTVSGDLFTLKERARIQGIFSGVWGVASLLGPLLGAAMTLSFGWRSIFSINVPLGAVAFVLVLTQMRESRASLADPFDGFGAATLATGVASALLATLQGPAAWIRIGLVAVSLTALLAFARSQSRSAHPLIPPSLFRRSETAAPYAAGLLLGTTIYGVDTFVPLFVQGARAGTAAAAGAVVTPVVLMWAVSAALAARAVVAFGFRRTAWAGALLIGLGFVALIVAVTLEAGVPWISAACALVGAGLGPSSMSQVLAVQSEAPEAERGVATSLVPFFRTVGGALGVSALGGIFSAGLRSRLGEAARTASAVLAGQHGRSGPGGAPSLEVREAIGASLLPVFVALLVLALFNLWVARRFPKEARHG